VRFSMKVVVGVLAAVVIGGGLFLLGRVTAPTHSAKAPGDYFAALRAGEAQGREEGRALQAGSELPAGDQHVARDAFATGYAAGANDVFAGYDGGWTKGAPWVVILDAGSGQVVYRIRDREPVRAGVNYYLCPDGHSLCQQPRR